jgi:hypothetical protein
MSFNRQLEVIDMFLSDEEIIRLTGRCRRKQQKQVLEAKGVRYFENGINELVVSRAHVERLLSGETLKGSEATPNFEALRKAS